MKIDTEILMRGQDVIPYEDFLELEKIIERLYHYSNYKFWMWKMLQIGYVYGKRTERAKRKAQHDKA